jgi:hypothetical protein
MDWLKGKWMKIETRKPPKNLGKSQGFPVKKNTLTLSIEVN